MTNPGEWPWAVLIFRGETYVGAGVLLDNNLVATTATKVKLLYYFHSLALVHNLPPQVQDYTSDPGALTVRLGDFDPMDEAPNSLEDFPHVTMEVSLSRSRVIPYESTKKNMTIFFVGFLTVQVKSF